MPQCWYRKVGLTSRVMMLYCQEVLGRPTEKGLKMHSLTCKALARRGCIKPDGVGERKWVSDNAHLILALVSRVKKERAEAAAKPEAQADFLKSFEWRRVRMMALKKYGARCQCCGATPATGAVMNVDHIKPRKLFPQLALDVDNLQVLCDACNHGKGNWDMTDWREPESAEGK